MSLALLFTQDFNLLEEFFFRMARRFDFLFECFQYWLNGMHSADNLPLFSMLEQGVFVPIIVPLYHTFSESDKNNTSSFISVNHYLNALFVNYTTKATGIWRTVSPYMSIAGGCE